MFNLLAIFTGWLFCGLQISKELGIGRISQFMMNHLRKKHHLNVDVKKRPTLPSVLFVNHWRIWYPKLTRIMWVQRNMKWNYESTTFIKNCVNNFITLGKLNQSNPRKVFCLQEIKNLITCEVPFPPLLMLILKTKLSFHIVVLKTCNHHWKQLLTFYFETWAWKFHHVEACKFGIISCVHGKSGKWGCEGWTI